MAAFARISMAVLAFGISFLGAAYVLMWAVGSQEAWILLCYAVPFGIVLRILRRRVISQVVRGILLGFALACPVLLALVSYGRFSLTVLVGAIALTVLTAILLKGFGPMGKVFPLSWVAALVLPLLVFFFDHTVFRGHIFAFKWSRVEHPFFFSPYELGEPERHGRKAIYVYDWNGADPSAVALVWGWSLYPKFVDLGDKRPDGSLLAIPSIRKVTQ